MGLEMKMDTAEARARANDLRQKAKLGLKAGATEEIAAIVMDRMADEIEFLRREMQGVADYTNDPASKVAAKLALSAPHI